MYPVCRHFLCYSLISRQLADRAACSEVVWIIIIFQGTRLVNEGGSGLRWHLRGGRRSPKCSRRITAASQVRRGWWCRLFLLFFWLLIGASTPQALSVIICPEFMNINEHRNHLSAAPTHMTLKLYYNTESNHKPATRKVQYMQHTGSCSV